MKKFKQFTIGLIIVLAAPILFPVFILLFLISVITNFGAWLIDE